MGASLKMVKCIIFDFDGVLADTEFGRFKQLSELLNQRGIDLSKRCSEKNLVGLSTTAFFRKYFPEMAERDIEELSFVRHQDYLKNLTKYCIPYPSMNETINRLKEKGYILVLATANETKSAHTLLNYVGVNKQFSAVYGREIMEDSNGNKSYDFIRNKIEYSPDECVVIEDSMVGISASKNAGYLTIAMNRYNDDQVMKTADIVVNDFNELLNIFENTV
jgi:beta-phosphoglucomutase